MSKKKSKAAKKAQKKALKKSRKAQVKNPSFWADKKNVWAVLGILAITTLALFPTLINEFVNWDDDRNFYENPLIVEMTKGSFWTQLKAIFTTPIIGNYNPLPILSFAIEEKLWGLDQPFYWHLDNLILHLLCTYLVYRLGLLLDLDWKGAVLFALLFGIHPMRVESVAWITERKDVLFGFFYLAAIFYYIKNHHSPKRKYLVIIFACFILSLLSKIQAVVLPLSLLAVDYYLRRPLQWSLVKEKIPYFILSLAIGLLGIYFLKDQGSLESNTTYDVWVRPFVGTYSYLIYLIKSVVPYRLSPLYPYPSEAPWHFFASAALVPVYIFGFYKAWKKDLRAIVFGIAFFTFNIMFLLQILGAGQGFLADRFTYIAYFGLFFIYAYYFDFFIKKYPNKRKIIMAIAAVILTIYGCMSFQQSKIWKNSATLWTHVIKYYQKTTLPFGNRANHYRDTGQYGKALADYTECISLNNQKPEPFNSRGKLYFSSTNRDTLILALSDYENAVALAPNKAEYHINLGAVKAKLNRPQEALRDLTRGIELDPNFHNGYLNRSVIYNNMGNSQAALDDITSYLRLKPNFPDLWYESARLKRKLNRPQESIADYDKAIGYNANKGLYYYERAKAHYTIGDVQKAKMDLQVAQQLNHPIEPGFVNALNGN